MTTGNTAAYTTQGEPLNGIAPVPAADRNKLIATPGSIQTATINVPNVLSKTVDLTPFSVDPAVKAAPAANMLFLARYANDVIFGGLGNDFLHGGVGDDAISGAEAVVGSYAATYVLSGQNLVRGGVVRSGWDRPFNDGSLLGYDVRSGDFVLYDEYDPKRKITFFDAGGPEPGDDRQLEWMLNFAADEGRERRHHLPLTTATT